MPILKSNSGLRLKVHILRTSFMETNLLKDISCIWIGNFHKNGCLTGASRKPNIYTYLSNYACVCGDLFAHVDVKIYRSFSDIFFASDVFVGEWQSVSWCSPFYPLRSWNRSVFSQLERREVGKSDLKSVLDVGDTVFRANSGIFDTVWGCLLHGVGAEESALANRASWVLVFGWRS